MSDSNDLCTFKQAMIVMEQLFAKDCLFALATAQDNRPSVRMIDTYYEAGSFYIVTYATSQKVGELTANPDVALCYQGYRFKGRAHNLGHPLAVENAELREKLIVVFQPWYFKHNDENDAHMCYIKIELESGFFYQDGTGYRVDFSTQTAQAFPFTLDIVIPE